MEADGTRSVYLVNGLCSRWSDSSDMTPWSVIEKTCIHRRIQNWQSWLAGEIGVTLAAVNNWKRRGVPAVKYRDISEALGISLEQLEGIDPLPWDDGEPDQLPFSDELIRKVLLLSHVKLLRLENVMRSHLGMKLQTLPDQATSSQLINLESRTDAYAGEKGDAPDPLKEAADLSVPHVDGREKVRRPARGKSHRRA